MKILVTASGFIGTNVIDAPARSRRQAQMNFNEVTSLVIPDSQMHPR